MVFCSREHSGGLIVKTAIFSTYDDGGAGIAALRLHKALQQAGTDSTFFYRWRAQEQAIKHGQQMDSAEVMNDVFDLWAECDFRRNIRPDSTICSVMYPSVGFDFLQDMWEYDIFHFHWITSFLSWEALNYLGQMGKPMLWTLHDQNPMTGACHYSAGCEGYFSDCANCPQLLEHPEYAQKILAVKEKYLPKDIVIVSPSRWMAECARKSRVFRHQRIEVIENSLDLVQYQPRSRVEARNSFSLPERARVVLFGANSLKEKRKGMHYLLEAMRILQRRDSLKEIFGRKEVYVLAFGHDGEVLEQMGLPYRLAGYTMDEMILSNAYLAADVTVLPSLEDNLPNIMLESLACGTPVAAFPLGGMTDVLENGKNGYLAEAVTAEALADVIEAALTGPDIRGGCREYAERKFSMKRQAGLYQQLYEDLLQGQKKMHDSCMPEVPTIFPELADVVLPGLCRAIVSEQHSHEEMRCAYQALQKQDDRLQQELRSCTEERNRLFHARNAMEADKVFLDGLLTQARQEWGKERQEWDKERQQREASLAQKEAALQQIYASRSWRFIQRVKRCVHKLGIK